MKIRFKKHLAVFDAWLLHISSRMSGWVSRMALFFVFFWFGILKVFGLSPAYDLVFALHAKTISFIPFEPFYVFLGLLEVGIGILFLFPKLTRLAILLLVLQMAATFLPLIVLPQITWQGLFIPTLEGQYILKNVVILALAMGLSLEMKPLEIDPELKKHQKHPLLQ